MGKAPVTSGSEAPDGERARARAITERAAQIAHELNNVFTPISGYASLIREELASGAPGSFDAAQMLVDLDVILTATRRGTELTKELMGIAYAR